jgi:hypothetical protein
MKVLPFGKVIPKVKQQAVVLHHQNKKDGQY